MQTNLIKIPVLREVNVYECVSTCKMQEGVRDAANLAKSARREGFKLWHRERLGAHNGDPPFVASFQRAAGN
jgi:hypothetical protein